MAQATLIEPTSETRVSTPASEPAHQRLTARLWPCAIPAFVSLCLTWYGLSRPDGLLGVHGYDDGVYFGAVLRFVDGAVPYRDFVFVHPPGIMLLLSPIGLLSHVFDDRIALAIARCATAVVAALCCFLVAYVLRHRGSVAALAGGLALACFPLAIAGDNTVLLEPYLAGLCLVGVALAFTEGELASRGRLAWAGAFFGVAGATKLWAIFPAVALMACCWGRWRSALRPFVAGMATAFGVLCLPFVVLAPGAFVHQVLVVQLARQVPASKAVGAGERLLTLTGLPGLTSVTASVAVGELVVAAFLAAVVLTFLLTGRRTTRFECFALLAMVLSGVAVLVSPEFYQYYAYFPVVFSTIVLGICIGRWSAVWNQARSTDRASLVRWLTPRRATAAGLTVVLALAAVAASQDVSATSSFMLGGQHEDPLGLVSNYMAPGSCVISDSPSILIASDRFSSQSGGCPLLVDSYGTWLAADPRHPAPSPGSDVPGLAAQWQTWMSEAQYVVLSVERSDFIPWNDELTSWFAAHYKLVASEPGVFVYIHVGLG